MCFLQDTIEYMTVGVCVHFMKKSFSQTVSEPEFLLSTYNISTDQSKDDYHLVTAGDYVLNTLLVVSVGLFGCLSFTFRKNAFIYVHETLHNGFLCLTPEAY